MICEVLRTCYLLYQVICCPVLSGSLQPHELQHAMLLCPLPSPGAAQIPVHSVSDAN